MTSTDDKPLVNPYSLLYGASKMFDLSVFLDTNKNGKDQTLTQFADIISTIEEDCQAKEGHVRRIIKSCANPLDYQTLMHEVDHMKIKIMVLHGEFETLKNHLNEYWKTGQFPTHNHNHHQEQRLPRFIDHSGIHCAIG
ncbi:unnamed protein product [Didymodactylos carnosus]|uniref:Uncharacterized protein n=1 Tax=Didymodactylos carnosus TaxID=1234261 RepID=A0A814FVS6_9BILA|nr:unnamed protein product [Didymodactylos carnosus]CAF3760342.1 unnamed protein product [Didymodactylos carnosus]